MSHKRCFSHAPPGVDLGELSGPLVVIEGPDSSGRTTQVTMLASALEQHGFAVEQVGLKRSQLVADELEVAKQGNVLSPRTMSLFYATDFYDQLENRIVPALRAGYVVLADRYFFTLMARDAVRGADPEWLRTLYAMAIVPDVVFYLDASIRNLVERTLASNARLDYWESGMDLGLSRDRLDSFLRYQRRLRLQFQRLSSHYGFVQINANRSPRAIQHELWSRVEILIRSELNGGGQGGAEHDIQG